MEDYKEPTKKSEPRKEKSRLSFNFTSILSLIAFIGIGCISISLLLTLIFEHDSTL